MYRARNLIAATESETACGHQIGIQARSRPDRHHTPVSIDITLFKLLEKLTIRASARWSWQDKRGSASLGPVRLL